MGDSKLKGCAEILAALGGARGILLIVTAISSLSFGSCKWNRAVQAETQRDNVIEGSKILVQQQLPKPIIKQVCNCNKIMDAHLEEFHR